MEQESGKGLEGLVVGIPAARRAEETAVLVGRWGGTPLVGPTVEERPVEDDGPLRAATREILDAPAAWSVHLTGVGTRRWFDRVEAWGMLPQLMDVIRHAGVVARGGKAARALAERRVEPVWVPPGERSSEIAVWLGPRIVPGQTVALQRHGDSSQALAQALTGAEARLVEVVTYRWSLPDDVRPAERLVQSLVGGEVNAIVITSAPQARHLFVVARRLGLEETLRSALASQVFSGAVGTVAGEGLQAEGIEPDLVATPARMGALLRGLAGARDQILAKNGSRSAPSE